MQRNKHMFYELQQFTGNYFKAVKIKIYEGKFHLYILCHWGICLIFHDLPQSLHIFRDKKITKNMSKAALLGSTIPVWSLLRSLSLNHWYSSQLREWAKNKAKYIIVNRFTIFRPTSRACKTASLVVTSPETSPFSSESHALFNGNNHGRVPESA